MKQKQFRNLTVRTLTATIVGTAALVGVVEASPPAGHFVVNAGTVTDTATGLVWQQAVDAGSYTEGGAATYCTNLSLNGTGWRLPTVAELQTIVDERRQNPSIDPTVFPSTPTAQYLTSSPRVGGSTSWRVSFDLGDATTAVQLLTYRVRCVR
jgi:hypothetical protein